VVFLVALPERRALRVRRERERLAPATSGAHSASTGDAMVATVGADGATVHITAEGAVRTYRIPSGAWTGGGTPVPGETVYVRLGPDGAVIEVRP
jgi:hypothetical protein